jgi:hypothetical protein
MLRSPHLKKLRLELSSTSAQEAGNLFAFIVQGAWGNIEELVVTFEEQSVQSKTLEILTNAFMEGKLGGLRTLILHGSDPWNVDAILRGPSQLENETALLSARRRPRGTQNADRWRDKRDPEATDESTQRKWQDIVEARKKLGKAFKGAFLQLCPPGRDIYCRCKQCGPR